MPGKKLSDAEGLLIFAHDHFQRHCEPAMNNDGLLSRRRVNIANDISSETRIGPSGSIRPEKVVPKLRGSTGNVSYGIECHGSSPLSTMRP